MAGCGDKVCQAVRHHVSIVCVLFESGEENLTQRTHKKEQRPNHQAPERTNGRDREGGRKEGRAQRMKDECDCKLRFVQCVSSAPVLSRLNSDLATPVQCEPG